MFSSLLIKLYISSVVKTKIGANHLINFLGMLKILTQSVLFFEVMLSNIERLFLYQS